MVNGSIKKLDRRFEQTLHQIGYTHVKRCSTPLTVRDSQVKPQWDITTYLLEWTEQNPDHVGVGENKELLVEMQMVQSCWKGNV